SNFHLGAHSRRSRSEGPPRPGRPPGDAPGEASDHDLLELGESSLSRLERGLLDDGIRALQRTVGQWWIRTATARLRNVHGLERLPAWGDAKSVILVS